MRMMHECVHDVCSMQILPMERRLLCYSLNDVELPACHADQRGNISTLWVPNRSSMSCDVGIFVNQAAEQVAASQVQG